MASLSRLMRFSVPLGLARKRAAARARSRETHCVAPWLPHAVRANLPACAPPIDGDAAARR